MTTLTSGGVPIRLDSLQPATQSAHPAILLLHGAGGNTDLWLNSIAPFVKQLGIALYAVHYFDRTGTVRADPATIRDGRHVPQWLETIRDTLLHIAAQPGVDPGRIALVGISLGAFLSLALPTLAGTPAVRAIVEISGGLAEPYAAAVTSSFPPTLILHGDQDTVVPVSNAHTVESTLTRLKIPHQTVLLPGEGHWFSHAGQLRILTSIATFLGSHLSIKAIA